MWPSLTYLVQPGTYTHGYIPKPLLNHWAYIFLALLMMAHTEAGKNIAPDAHTADTENLACFHFLHLPKGFCKTSNYAATHFVLSLSELPISYLSNKYQIAGVRPGLESWLCHRVTYTVYVTSSLGK